MKVKNKSGLKTAHMMVLVVHRQASLAEDEWQIWKKKHDLNQKYTFPKYKLKSSANR